MANYDYYKQKYKTYTVKFDRERDADIIALLDNGAEITGVVRFALRYYLTLKQGGLDNGEKA